MSTPEPDAEREKSTSEILGEALGGVARRAGLDPSESAATHTVVWTAMGGWRGILESVLPSLAFVIIFTIRPEPLILSLGISVGLAAVFTIVRLVQKSPPSAALGGLIAAVAAAALALWTGRGADNFVPGLITNAVYGSVILVSALIGWSLIGLAVGFLMGRAPPGGTIAASDVPTSGWGSPGPRCSSPGWLYSCPSIWPVTSRRWARSNSSWGCRCSPR